MVKLFPYEAGNTVRRIRALAPKLTAIRAACVVGAVVHLLICGCSLNSMRNAWLSPAEIGNFEDTGTSEIRSSLSLEDMPSGIPGAEPPVPADLVIQPIEPRISPGDTLAIEIFELRQPLVPYQAQVAVSGTGSVNLPVVGRLQADGLTPEEFEQAIVDLLRDREILIAPDVTVNPLFVQGATYSIFGVGVSAANNAPLRAGTFPIQRPGLRILEAINQVGGLNEFVEDIYVFRYADSAAGRTGADERDRRGAAGHRDDDAGLRADARFFAADAEDAELPPEAELIAAVVEPLRRRSAPQAGGAGPPPVEPGPDDPFMWVGDEFVPNPAYRPAADAADRPAPPPENAFSPSVDWDRIAGDVSYRILQIPAETLRSGDPQVNIVIRPGDVIRIVSGQIGVYYVMGQVNRVGAFAFNAEPISLKSAIASAGGLAGLAWPSRCTVYRRLGRREQMIQVDLDRIFAGLDADFLIKRGDIINVGTHPFAPFLQRLRAWTLPNPVATVGYSYTYARSFNFVTNRFR